LAPAKSGPQDATASVARMSEARSGFVTRSPHIVEPVIGRAFARPVGSCGLTARAALATKHPFIRILSILTGLRLTARI
jgi:hypothetical protein